MQIDQAITLMQLGDGIDSYAKDVELHPKLNAKTKPKDNYWEIKVTLKTPAKVGKTDIDQFLVYSSDSQGLNVQVQACEDCPNKDLLVADYSLDGEDSLMAFLTGTLALK